MLAELIDFILAAYTPSNIIELISVTLLLVTLPLILPITLLIKHFKATGSKDYLILATWLSTQIIQALLIPVFAGENYFKLLELNRFVFNIAILMFNMIGFDLLLLLIFLYSIRLRWIVVPSKIYFVGMPIILLTFIKDIIMVLSPDPLSISYHPIVLISTALLFLIISIILLYSILTIKPIVFQRNINNALKIWSIVAGFNIFNALSLLPFLLIPNLFPDPESIQFIIYLSGTFSNFLISALLFIISYFYPESLLISESQLVRAFKIDNLRNNIPENPTHHTFEKIEAYITSIPETWLER